MLAAILLDAQKPWYASELARHLKVQRSTLQRDLAKLASSGILRASRIGNLAYFQANESCPVFPELRSFFLKTTGLVDVLFEGLSPLVSKITVAAVYGSIAAGKDTAGSDVDLLIIGSLGLMDLVPMIGSAASKLRRQVNPTIYTPEAFAQKAGHSRFVQSVLGKPLLFVIGTMSDVETVTGRKAHRPGGDRPGGD